MTRPPRQPPDPDATRRIRQPQSGPDATERIGQSAGGPDPTDRIDQPGASPDVTARLGAAPPPPPPPPLPYPTGRISFEPQTEAIGQRRPEKTNGLAIAAFVLSLLGVVVLSVIFGIIALVKTRDPSQGGRGLAIASLLISAVWAVAIAALVAFVVIVGTGSVRATDVKVGDCIADVPASPRVESLKPVTCNQPHQGEVYAVLTMPDGPFPGQPAIDGQKNKCEPELANFAAGAAKDPAVGIYVLYPTPQTWAGGDRAVTCVATTTAKRTGSIKG